MAISHDCKYVEVSATLGHNVDTLLVGIVKQIRLKMMELQNRNSYARYSVLDNIDIILKSHTKRVYPKISF